MAKVEYLTIPGFNKMSKQRIFNKAVAHIAITRQKSDIHGACKYGGSGCNAAPLLREDMLSRADNIGAWAGLVEAGMVPATNEQFVIELQRAHDQSATGDSFMKFWKSNMGTLAARWNLSTSTLDKVVV